MNINRKIFWFGIFFAKNGSFLYARIEARTEIKKRCHYSLICCCCFLSNWICLLEIRNVIMWMNQIHTHTRIDKQTFHFFIYFSSFFFLCYTNITLRNCNGNEKQLPNGINEWVNIWVKWNKIFMNFDIFFWWEEKSLKKYHYLPPIHMFWVHVFDKKNFSRDKFFRNGIHFCLLWTETVF